MLVQVTFDTEHLQIGKQPWQTRVYESYFRGVIKWPQLVMLIGMPEELIIQRIGMAIAFKPFVFLESETNADAGDLGLPEHGERNHEQKNRSLS
jgi:hypothetical protein